QTRQFGDLGISHALDRQVGRGVVPVRLVMFALVGASGVAVHLVSLRVAMIAFTFPLAQAIATAIAIASNFTINNALTYRDRRLRGLRLFAGLLSFFAICSVGAIANVGIAVAAFQRQYVWWLSALAGTAVGLVWNYAVSAALTWRSK